MGAPRHCERSEAIRLSTRHSSEALAAPVAESSVSTIDGFGGRGTWKSASEQWRDRGSLRCANKKQTVTTLILLEKLCTEKEKRRHRL